MDRRNHYFGGSPSNFAFMELTKFKDLKNVEQSGESFDTLRGRSEHRGKGNEKLSYQ